MKRFFDSLIVIAGSSVAIGLTGHPASAQYYGGSSYGQQNGYNNCVGYGCSRIPGPQRERFQRSNGWSSGDYFGPEPYRSPVPKPITTDNFMSW